MIARHDAAHGGWQYHHPDALGSTVAVTNAAGTVIGRYLYDPFGLPDIRDANGNARTATAIGNPWLFTGQEWRGDVQLANYKARWYQPTLGRFLQNDPVRFDAGDLNLYRYCFNNPINHTDPSGAIVETLWDIGNAAMGYASAFNNARKGNWGDAGIDLAGAAVDTLAAAIPVVPGGVSTVIQATRAADKAMEAARNVDNAVDAARTVDHAKSTGSANSAPGSYTNHHASGKTYDGKGSKERSQTSARRVEAETGDQHIATEWTPAPDQREAFKQESRRLDSHGGPKSDSNHNKIESPGKKMRKQDKER